VGDGAGRGMFFTPISGDRKLPTCATRDIAATAARLLLDDSWSGPGHVAVLGPEDLSFNDMAQIMSEVLGRPVLYQQIPAEAMTDSPHDCCPTTPRLDDGITGHFGGLRLVSAYPGRQ
jgi:uncharacterized protein YbjT (DUF2867 family)